MKFRLLTILFLFGALAQVRAQSNSIYSIAPMAVCWNTPENVDSNLIAYWLFSSRETTPKVVSYLTASGTAVVVAGGTVQNGFCCCNGGSQDTLGIEISGDTLFLTQNNITYTYVGGGGADDDWRWVDPAGDNMYQAIYRQGKASIFTTDTTHAFRVDSTFQFRVDGDRSIFDWSRGDSLFPEKTWLFRAPGGGTGQAQNDANVITIARTNATTTRTTVGKIKFAAPFGVGDSLRIAAQIDVLDEEGGGDTTNTSINFYTRQLGESFIRNTMTIEGNGRLELDRYNLFEDGVPERMLGYDDTDKDVKVSDITGNATAGNILGINPAGNGMEWKDPDTLGAVVPTIFTGGTFAGSSTLDMQYFPLIFTNSGSFAISGDTNGGGVPVTGAGGRFMWVDESSSIRAGLVDAGIWDNVDMGYVSASIGGYNNNASGDYGFVGGGENNNATEFLSFVGGGQNNTASGFRSFVGGGDNNLASGNSAFVLGGEDNVASGFTSFVLGGLNNTAPSLSETVVGPNATNYTASGAGTYVTTDRIFTIGNGTSAVARSAAMIVYKGGVGAAKTYINPGTSTTVPTETLRIGGTTRADGVLSVNNGSTSAGQIVVAEDSDDGANTATITLSGALAANTTFPIPVNALANGSVLTATSATTATWAAVTSDTVVLNGSWVNIGANKLRVHSRNGLVSIQGFIRGGTIGTTLPGSPDVELPFGGFLVSNGFQCVANDDGVLKAVAVQDINGDLSFQSLSGGSIDLSGGSDYLFFSITYYNP